MATAALLISGCGGSGSYGTSNAKPQLAVLAAPGNLNEGAAGTIRLDASDPDGDSIALHWEQLSGAPVNGLAEAGSEFAFTAPQVTADDADGGTVMLRVTADDGKGGSASATIDFTVTNVWDHPECDVIAGTRHFAFSRDGGATFVFPEQSLPSTTRYAAGLLRLSTPGHLLLSVSTETGTVFQRSRDAGCSWEDIGSSDSNYLKLSSGGGDIAYAWSWFGNTIHRIDTNAPAGTGIESIVVPVTASSNGLLNLDVLKDSDTELLAQDRDGNFRRSNDGGRTWDRGTQAPPVVNTYHATTEPDDLAHIVLGVVKKGLYVSYDGGANWSQSAVVSDTYNGSDINVFNTAYARGDDSTVWALGLNMDEHFDNADTQGRHIYRSQDGGQTFSPVIDSYQEPDIILTNGNFMHAPEGRPDELFFSFFSCAVADEDDYENPGRTYLYFYDHSSGSVTVHKHKELEGVSSIFFAPNDPQLIYVGMDSDVRC